MKFLSVTDVVFLHDGLIDAFGGSHGVRDDNLLDSAVSRCQASYDGKDLYGTIFGKAAAILHGILFDHPFIDGNKRTAITCAVQILEQNGWKFIGTNEDVIAFPLAVEKSRPKISEIAQWFKNHCKKVKNK